MNPYTRTLCLVLCASAGSAFAQPTFESPSPTQGSSTSQKANEMADKGMYKPVEYANAAKPGPAIIVIPGEVKSNNASFAQKFGPNNIADFAELELGKANFKVLERSNLGPLLQEFERDLHRHVHLENNILFPRALEALAGSMDAIPRV